MVLDIDSSLISSLKMIGGLSMKCIVYKDNFNFYYETPLKLGLNSDETALEVSCAVQCDPDVRYLEFTVWVDETIKLITTS